MSYRQCVAITAKGKRCPIGANPGTDLCHVHDPSGVFQQQRAAKREADLRSGKKPKKPRARPASTTAQPSRRQRKDMPVPAGAIEVYTDGACQPTNPGPGGWGWTVQDGPEGSGGDPWTTNQRMELQAALEALGALPGPVLVVSDSMYLVQCFQDDWWRSWVERGWMRGPAKKPEPVKNRDIWEPLVDLYREREHEVAFRWVKGHSGVALNERADVLATAAAVGAASTTRSRGLVYARPGAEPAELVLF